MAFTCRPHCSLTYKTRCAHASHVSWLLLTEQVSRSTHLEMCWHVSWLLEGLALQPACSRTVFHALEALHPSRCVAIDWVTAHCVDLWSTHLHPRHLSGSWQAALPECESHAELLDACSTACWTIILLDSLSFICGLRPLRSSISTQFTGA